jgi:hypothetical protein
MEDKISHLCLKKWAIMKWIQPEYAPFAEEARLISLKGTKWMQWLQHHVWLALYDAVLA